MGQPQPQPENGTKYRLDQLSERIKENTQAIHENEDKFRARFHSIEASIAGVNLVLSRQPDIERRVIELEEHNVAVIARDVRYLDKRVDQLVTVGWSIFGGVLLAVVTFALAVASGQI